MIADVAVPLLLRLQLAGSAAILLVLLLRPFLRLPLGPELAYRLWWLPPTCAIASLFPSLAEFRASRFGPVAYTPSAQPGYEWVSALARGLPSGRLLLLIWALGAAGFLAVLVWNELKFRKLARQGLAGPAVVGVLWPRIVTPSDYESQFNATERDHIRRHELTHIERRDPHHNLVLAGVRVLFWFNPLIHLAAGAMRLDQELACDAALIERRPTLRRQYAEALLKAHFIRSNSPLACAWAPLSRHPLELRVAMIGRPGLTRGQYVARLLAVGALALVMAAGVWGLSPISSSADTGFRWSQPHMVAEMDLTPDR